jgi:exosortase A
MNVRTLARPDLNATWRAQRSVMIALGVGLIALGLLFQNEITAAVGVWTDSTAYNHCFLIIPIAAYLVWDRRGTFSLASARPFPLSALAAIPLALAWLVAERLGIMEGRQLVAMSFAELLFFTMFGPALWWRLAGPLLYLYFLVPFGAFLTPALQDFTTVFVRHGLAVLHIPAYIDGYLIQIPEGSFLIAEACAGLRFLVAATAFGCLYALLMYRSPLRRVIFIVASLVVPIIANGFRALGIVALGHYMGSAQAVEADHVLYGWIFFSIVILLLIALGLPFREDHQPQTMAQPAPPAASGHMRAALIGAVSLIVLAGIGPAVAVQLDSAAGPAIAADLTTLVPGRGCSLQPTPLTDSLGVPGRLIVQRIACADGTVRLTIEVFSPRSTANRLFSEQRRLTQAPSGADVETRPLNVADAPAQAWRMIEVDRPYHISATSLWVDGKPVQGGMRARLHQALNSILGSRFSPVLIVVAPDVQPMAVDSDARRLAERGIITFLQSRSSLSGLIDRLAGPGGGRS